MFSCTDAFVTPLIVQPLLLGSASQQTSEHSRQFSPPPIVPYDHLYPSTSQQRLSNAPDNDLHRSLIPHPTDPALFRNPSTSFAPRHQPRSPVPDPFPSHLHPHSDHLAHLFPLNGEHQFSYSTHPFSFSDSFPNQSYNSITDAYHFSTNHDHSQHFPPSSTQENLQQWGTPSNEIPFRNSRFNQSVYHPQARPSHLSHSSTNSLALYPDQCFLPSTHPSDSNTHPFEESFDYRYHSLQKHQLSRRRALLYGQYFVF